MAERLEVHERPDRTAVLDRLAVVNVGRDLVAALDLAAARGRAAGAACSASACCCRSACSGWCGDGCALGDAAGHLPRETAAARHPDSTHNLTRSPPRSRTWPPMSSCDSLASTSHIVHRRSDVIRRVCATASRERGSQRQRASAPERIGAVMKTPPPELLETIGNLAAFHREHEKFYSQAPLRQAIEVQAASRVLKGLADRWSDAVPADHPAASPFAGARDLNPPGLAAKEGVLFMGGKGSPRRSSDCGAISRRLPETSRRSVPG